MVMLPLGFLLASQLSYAASLDGYRYLNCADQRQGLPLQTCAAIEISSDLSTVFIRDYGEETSRHSAIGVSSFKAVESEILPIAVPSTGYATTPQWEYDGHIYLRISTLVELAMPWPHAGDLIVVVPTTAQSTKLAPVARALSKVAKLVFRYSEQDGVTAIAFPDASRDSGELFYCAAKPCLFAKLATR